MQLLWKESLAQKKKRKNRWLVFIHMWAHYDLSPFRLRHYDGTLHKLVVCFPFFLFIPHNRIRLLILVGGNKSVAPKIDWNVHHALINLVNWKRLWHSVGDVFSIWNNVETFRCIKRALFPLKFTYPLGNIQLFGRWAVRFRVGSPSYHVDISLPPWC